VVSEGQKKDEQRYLGYSCDIESARLERTIKPEDPCL
jgi:hypothetical protein